MRTIFKYPLDGSDLEVHKGYKVVHAGHDPQDELCLWAEVDTDAPLETVKLMVVGTGQAIPTDDYEHVASFKSSPFMWHVYGSTS